MLLLAAATAAVGAVTATDAAATSCSAITISANQNVSFDVSSVTVQRGGCVRFANLTDVTVTVRVSGSSFSERLPARTPASASASYTATKSATVTATDGVRSGQGRIDVEGPGSTTAATPTPTPSRSTIVTPPSQSGTPKPASSPTRSGGSGGSQIPGDVSTEAPAAVNTQHAIVLPGLPAPPPPPATSNAAPPTASHPVVAPQVKPAANSTDPRVTSTTLEPVSGTGRGLPATVAAVLLLGLAAAYGRTVLVAGEAVDSSLRPRPLRPTV